MEAGSCQAFSNSGRWLSRQLLLNGRARYQLTPITPGGTLDIGRKNRCPQGKKRF